MTIEEKMEHFKNMSLENASQKSNDILTAYKNSLDEEFEKHKEEARTSSKALEEAKLGTVRLEAKRELAKAQSEVRRSLSTHQNKLKSEIFAAVNEKINEYKNTDEYKELLVRQINSIINDFSDEEIVFFIDASDESHLEYLLKETKATIEISQSAFIGGTKAVIESKNMLFDNSLKTKLSEEQEKFSISL